MAQKRVLSFVSLPSAAYGFAVLLLLLASACASNSNRGGDTMVPEDSQQRSRERYGEQEMYMNSLNQTPAEQSATEHQNAVRPVENPNREGGRER